MNRNKNRSQKAPRRLFLAIKCLRRGKQLPGGPSPHSHVMKWKTARCLVSPSHCILGTSNTKGVCVYGMCVVCAWCSWGCVCECVWCVCGAGVGRGVRPLKEFGEEQKCQVSPTHTLCTTFSKMVKKKNRKTEKQISQERDKKKTLTRLDFSIK